MKLRDKKELTVTRMCLALAGIICIIISMRECDCSQSYLTMGLAFTAAANFLSCKGKCFKKKTESDR